MGSHRPQKRCISQMRESFCKAVHLEMATHRNQCKWMWKGNVFMAEAQKSHAIVSVIPYLLHRSVTVVQEEATQRCREGIWKSHCHTTACLPSKTLETDCLPLKTLEKVWPFLLTSTYRILLLDPESLHKGRTNIDPSQTLPKNERRKNTSELIF